MHGLVLSSISWDPFIRGVLIVAIAVLVLCGSVYLLLATNTGARVGFLLAVAGLTGWMGLMGIVWMVTGSTADIGRPASWKVQEVVTGDINELSTTTSGFPKGFEKVQAGDPELGDAQSAADKVLASSAAAAPTAGAEGGASTSRFQPPFSTPDEYIQDSVWRMDPTTVWHIRRHKITPYGHDKHVEVVQVRPVVVQPPNPDGTPVKPVADLSKPLTSVVMVRDLGSLHQPQLFMAVGSFIIFGITCYALHRRDKEIWAARASAAAG